MTGVRVLVGGMVCAAEPPASAPATAAKLAFWLIPHTHWEGAVFKTREEYLEMGLPNILTAVRLLKEHPNYRFVLDQVAYFRPFLERYPEEAVAFRKFVADGRLQIVGGLNIMPDDNMPSGESFVRQMLYAKGYCRQALGVEVRVGWLLDTFGHHAQLPQLLKLGGYNSFWFFRGVEDREKMPSEFLWQGLDGTRIPAFWLPFAYGHVYGPPADLKGFGDFMKNRFDALAPFSRGGDRVGLAGVDVSEPELHVPALVDQFNRQASAPFTLRIGVPTDFEAVVARRTDLPVITGERNPLFQGIYSSRIELKQRMRTIERLLTSVEEAGVQLQWLGGVMDETLTWSAWEPALFNVTHDLVSGVMTDGVYADTLRSYDFAQHTAENLLESRLAGIAARIDTRGEGVPMVVFNPLGWARTDVAEGDVGFARGGVRDFRLVDASGAPVPSQVLESEQYADGGLKRVKFAFVAREVPALGHAVYHVVPLEAADPARTAPAAAGGAAVLENEFYRAGLDLGTGALTNLFVKAGAWEALSGPANVVAREADQGDFLELYKNLDGFQNVIMTRPLGVPRAPQAQFSDAERGTNGVVRRGPVFSEFQVSHPLGSNSFSTTIRLYQGVPRLDFHTRIVNREALVRYRLLAPTSIEQGTNVQEIPFGAIQRPLAQEFPAQNWIDLSEARRGVALLNRGLPGNNVAESTLMVSLLRSTRIQNYGIGGGFEGQGSDSGLELGKELSFDYALAPHAGDWREARVYRAGLEFNHPLLVRKATSHAGSLPPRWGWLEITPASVVLSALKPGPGGSAVLRVYDAGGLGAAGAAVKVNGRLVSVEEANLMEDGVGRHRFDKDTFRFDLRPFEIKTFRLHLRPIEKARGNR